MAEFVLGGGESHGAEFVAAFDGNVNLVDAGDEGAAVVDDLRVAIGLDHDVGWLEVLMQGFTPMHRAEAVDGLGDDVDDLVHVGLGVGRRPFLDGLPFDFLHQVEKEIRSLTLVDDTNEVRIVDSFADPFLGDESFNVGRIVLVIP